MDVNSINDSKKKKRFETDLLVDTKAVAKIAESNVLYGHYIV